MVQFITRRLLWLIPVVLGMTVITFTISNLVPADPIRAIAGSNARPEQVESLRREWGMDKPLPQQYLTYLGNLFRGNLGISIHTRRPVLEDIKEYFPATLEVTLAAVILMVAVGIPLGVLSAVRQGRMVDHINRLICIGGIAMPIFFLGLLFQLIFYRWLNWLPAQGRIDILISPPRHFTGMYVLDSIVSANWSALLSSLKHLLLPALTLALGSLAMISRMVRASMLEVLGCDYIRTARAKGLVERLVIYRHAFRNAMIPMVTLLALQIGLLLGGAFLVEIIFSWPGIGLYAVRSMLAVDFPAIMGVTLLIVIIYVLINLLADLIYGSLNPCIRLE